MQRITYVPPWEDVEDPEKGITFSLSYPYLIGSPRGTGGVEARIASSASPLLPGVPVHNISFADRVISFFIHIKGNDRKHMYALRQKLAGALAPYNGSFWERPGRIYYQNDNGSFFIDAIPLFSPQFEERIKNYNKAQLEFRCPDPLWKSADRQTANLVESSGLFRFPFAFPVKFGTLEYTRTLSNRGHCAAPVSLYISGTGVQNPTIRNLRTGEMLRVVAPIETGDTLYVNTSYWDRAVEIIRADGSRENAYHYLDLDSSFFHILPGDNTLRYTSDTPDISAAITIEWREQWAGV